MGSGLGTRSRPRFPIEGFCFGGKLLDICAADRLRRLRTHTYTRRNPFSSWSKWDSPVVFTILCFASPISALAPIQVFGAPTPYHSFRRLSILVALSIVCFPAFARLTVLDQSRHYLGAETIEAFVMLPVYAFLMVACALLAAGLAFVFSCGVIIGLNYLVLIVAYPAVRWLARHPKGAWSAFVFAVTMLLGFLRLFI